MENIYLGKIVDIDLYGKNVFTDKGIKAIMPDNAKFGDHIGLNANRRSYVMSDEEASLYAEPDAERKNLEDMANQLGISFQKSTRNETLKRKIDEAIKRTPTNDPQMNTGE